MSGRPLDVPMSADHGHEPLFTGIPGSLAEKTERKRTVRATLRQTRNINA